MQTLKKGTVLILGDIKIKEFGPTTDTEKKLTDRTWKKDICNVENEPKV